VDVATDITNTIVQQEKLSLPISGVDVTPHGSTPLLCSLCSSSVSLEALPPEHFSCLRCNLVHCYQAYRFSAIDLRSSSIAYQLVLQGWL